MSNIRRLNYTINQHPGLFPINKIMASIIGIHKLWKWLTLAVILWLTELLYYNGNGVWMAYTVYGIHGPQNVRYVQNVSHINFWKRFLTLTWHVHSVPYLDIIMFHVRTTKYIHNSMLENITRKQTIYKQKSYHLKYISVALRNLEFTTIYFTSMLLLMVNSFYMCT